MRLIALMPVRNEAWILGLSARVALMWCDGLIVLNHASTDGTGDVLSQLSDEFGSRIQIHTEPNAEWFEMEHRQRLLALARQDQATHVAIVDADEILCGDSLPTVRQRAEELRPGQVLTVRMHCMWRSIRDYRVDPGVWSNRRDLCLAFRDKPGVTWAPTGGYHHHARQPAGTTRSTVSDLGVLHLQWGSWRRLLSKQAWYKMHERLAYPTKPVQQIDRLYNQAVDDRGLRTDPAPEAWWSPYAPLMQYIDLDAEPWQEAECRRLLAEHGAAYFKGLDLFGVV